MATRGPKSSAALREMGVPVAVTAAEPCTWREMIGALDESFGPSLEGLEPRFRSTELQSRTAQRAHRAQCQWMRVPVYQWALPDDLEPLKNSIHSIAAGEVDVIVFLTAMQVSKSLRSRSKYGDRGALREGIRNTVVLSIGPSTSAELERQGIHPDFEPSHPKMGFLMNEASECAVQLLEEKRGSPSGITLTRPLSYSTRRHRTLARPGLTVRMLLLRSACNARSK